MALLNWGNALSQAGKAMATVGLEGVKATMEQDKVRLAADLAAEEGILSDERKAKSAIALAGTQGDIAATAASTLAGVNTETARQLAATNKLTAEALVEAKRKDPAELAALNASLSARALNEFTLSNAKAVNKIQTQLAAITGTDPASMSQKAILKQQLTAMGTTAASISADKTGAVALYTSSASKYISATAERVKAAAVLNLDPENADAKEASRAAIDAEQDTNRIYDAAVNYLRETNPEFKISSRPSDPRTGTPAPAPTPGTGTAKPGALPKSGTRTVTETPGVFSRIGTSVTNALAAQGRMEMDTANAASRPTYQALANEINAAFKNKTKVELPAGGVNILKSIMAFDPELLDPSARNYAAGLSKPGTTKRPLNDFNSPR